MLNASLFASRGACPNGRPGNSAACGTNLSTTTTTKSGAKAGAKRRTTNSFKNAHIIGLLGLALDLIGGKLFTSFVFSLKLLEGFSLRWKSFDRGAHGGGGATREKESAAKGKAVKFHGNILFSLSCLEPKYGAEREKKWRFWART
jgi:hypothetical protein